MKVYRVTAWEYWGSAGEVITAYVTAKTEGAAQVYFKDRCGMHCPVIRSKRITVK